MVVKCKNCGTSIFLSFGDKAFMNRAIYCEHCNKIIFYTELPYAILFSIAKWILFLVIFCVKPYYIFEFLIFWSIVDKIFMIISYKYFYKI